MWDEFNIKTFDAETVVYRDGVYCPELSTIVGTDFDKKYDRPIHIIYVGDIAGNYRLNVNIFVENLCRRWWIIPGKTHHRGKQLFPRQRFLY